MLEVTLLLSVHPWEHLCGLMWGWNTALLPWENRFWPRDPCPEQNRISEKSLVHGPSPEPYAQLSTGLVLENWRYFANMWGLTLTTWRLWDEDTVKGYTVSHYSCRLMWLHSSPGRIPPCKGCCHPLQRQESPWLSPGCRPRPPSLSCSKG